jgi:type IV secretory pathway VirB4 component
MQESNLELFTKYKTTVPVALPLELFKRHCYISGLSGSGKSELIKRMIFAFQKSKECAIVLLDPHGDMAEEVFRLQHPDPERIVLIDPFLFPGHTPVLNPFQLTHTDSVSVELATQQFVRVFEELIKDTQLSNQMRTVLAPCVGTLLRAGNKSLYDLQRFMSEGNNRDLIALGAQSPNPSHRQFFQSEFNNKEYSATKSSIYTKVFSLLGTQTFFNLTVGSSTFSLEQAIEDHKIIIFNLSKGIMGDEASRAFGQFVVGRLQSIAQRRAKQLKSDRTPTYLLVDEFQDYVTSSMAKILKEDRKYALHLVLANQFMDDIRNPAILQAIKTNTDIKLHGRNISDHFNHFYETMLLEKEDLLRLEEFEFYVKAGTTPPYKMKGLQVPEVLAEEADFQHLLNRTKQYYTPINLHDRSKTQRKTPKFKL